MMKKWIITFLLVAQVGVAGEEVESQEASRVSDVSSVSGWVLPRRPIMLSDDDDLDERLDSLGWSCCHKDVCFCKTFLIFCLCCVNPCD